MPIPILRRALLGALVTAGLAASLIARPALAGSLDVVASFTAKASQLDVATYYRSESEAVDGRAAGHLPQQLDRTSVPTSGNP